MAGFMRVFVCMLYDTALSARDVYYLCVLCVCVCVVCVVFACFCVCERCRAHSYICAGMTAVDAAEDKEAEAMAVNCDGPAAVAAAAAAAGAKVVYYSTECVGDGVVVVVVVWWCQRWTSLADTCLMVV